MVIGPSDDESDEFRLPKKRSLGDNDVISFKFNNNCGELNEIEEVYASFQMQQQNSPFSYMFDDIQLRNSPLLYTLFDDSPNFFDEG